MKIGNICYTYGVLTLIIMPFLVTIVFTFLMYGFVKMTGGLTHYP